MGSRSWRREAEGWSFEVLQLKVKVPSELVPTSGGLSSTVLLHTSYLPAYLSQIR